MNLTKFIINLIKVGAIFGPKAKKLAGIDDRASVYTGSTIFVAPNEIILSGPIPTFLRQDTKFRVTGGGPNAGALLTVISVTGTTVTVTPAVTAFAGIATFDGRLAVVINDPNVARLTDEGATMFNVNYQGPTPNLSGGVSATLTAHFHADAPPSPGTGNIVVDRPRWRLVGSEIMVLNPRVEVFLHQRLELLDDSSVRLEDDANLTCM